MGTLSASLCKFITRAFFLLQTHTKIAKKSLPGQMQSITPGEAVLTVAEPPPYGTVHAVGAMTIFSFPSLYDNFEGIVRLAVYC